MLSLPRHYLLGGKGEVRMSEKCRCGHQGDEVHPCHADGYQCRKPAEQRFYNARPVALTGVMMKLEMTETWACDECWKRFIEALAAEGATSEHGR